MAKRAVSVDPSPPVEKAAGAADELHPDDVFPHALRATAATFHTGRGLDVLALQGLMGWAQASTAEVYVQHSPEMEKKQLAMKVAAAEYGKQPKEVTDEELERIRVSLHQVKDDSEPLLRILDGNNGGQEAGPPAIKVTPTIEAVT